MKDFVSSRVTLYNRHMNIRHPLLIVLSTALFALPSLASAATSSSFEISGWIPYWRSATGTADVLPHLDLITEVNPFVSRAAGLRRVLARPRGEVPSGLEHFSLGQFTRRTHALLDTLLARPASR